MQDTYNWTLKYEEYDPEQQGLREALCTLGNGYFGTRGAFTESDDDGENYPGTYLAGGYNRLGTEITGRVIENEDLVNLPNWLSISFRINGGEKFCLKAVKILSFEQNLDLKRGVLQRTVRFCDAHKRITTLEEERLVHMRYFHLGAIKWMLYPENWSGKVEVISSLDGKVTNNGVPRYRELNSLHLQPLDSGVNHDQHMYLKMEMSQSKVQIAQAARHQFYLNEQKMAVKPFDHIEKDFVGQSFTFDIQEGDALRLEKTVALYTSRDKAISEPLIAAQTAVARAPEYQELFRTQALAWKALWGQFDIEIETKYEPKEHTRSLLILRLHIFHLLQTVSLNTIDLDVGVPARGWHGEAYRGHIFWDELFIFPLLNLRIPKITLALLKYRYRRLGEAREAARASGFKGAMFPWQSGSNGREESQQMHLNPKSGRWIPDHSYIQRHVSLAIAYNTWRYFEVTRDMDFLRSYGAEIILEVARFFESLSHYNKESGRYEIHHVMGPDEYHDGYPGSENPGLNNNAYTNLMVVWTLKNALRLLEILPEDHCCEVRELIDLEQEEVEKWQQIVQKMRIDFQGGGIISQFQGYDQLKEFAWEEYQKKYGDIQRLDRILEAEGDSPNRYKLSKQADVLMLFYLFSADELLDMFSGLGYKFSVDLIPKNIDYYLHRTSHGSTLSRIVHSWVLSREDRSTSWNLFVNSLESDIADIQGGTTPEGIHLGSMAGTVDIIQRCYSGVLIRHDVLWFNPILPENLKRMHFHIHYRGHSIEVEITQTLLTVTSKRSIAQSIQVGFAGKTYTLNAGETQTFIPKQLQNLDYDKEKSLGLRRS